MLANWHVPSGFPYKTVKGQKTEKIRIFPAIRTAVYNGDPLNTQFIQHVSAQQRQTSGIFAHIHLSKLVNNLAQTLAKQSLAPVSIHSI